MDLTRGAHRADEAIGKAFRLLMTNAAGAVFVEREASFVEKMPTEFEQGVGFGAVHQLLIRVTGRAQTGKNQQVCNHSRDVALQCLGQTELSRLFVLDEGELDDAVRFTFETQRK